MEAGSPLAPAQCFYLYGILRCAPLEMPVLGGIEGRGDVSLVSFRELACAVSPVPLSEYSSEQMEERARQLDWVAPRALGHQQVVQWLWQTAPVVPLKFGTLCSSRDKVCELLQEHYETLLRLLEFFDRREEWGVKIYVQAPLPVRAVERQASRSDEEARLSAGQAYFLRKKLARVAEEDQHGRMSELAEQIYGRLLPHAVAGRPSRFLNPSQEGGQVPLLNAAFLLGQENLRDFEDAAARLEADYQDYGVRIELSGPWPPYSFCEELSAEPAEAAGQRCGG